MVTMYLWRVNFNICMPRVKIGYNSGPRRNWGSYQEEKRVVSKIHWMYYIILSKYTNNKHTMYHHKYITTYTHTCIHQDHHQIGAACSNLRNSNKQNINDKLFLWRHNIVSDLCMTRYLYRVIQLCCIEGTKCSLATMFIKYLLKILIIIC